jgi:hypothetical protein
LDGVVLPLSDLTRRQKIIGAVVVALVVLTAVTVTTWLEVTDGTADEVDASWRLRCPGTKVSDYHSQPAIHSRPGWRCDVIVSVRNESDHDVHVSGVASPLLASDDGAEVRGYSTEGAKLKDVDHDDEIDARWEVDVTVHAHESHRFMLAVGWRQQGCDTAGWLTIPDWPTVEFDTYHRTFTVSPDQALVLRTYSDPHDDKVCPD